MLCSVCGSVGNTKDSFFCSRCGNSLSNKHEALSKGGVCSKCGQVKPDEEARCGYCGFPFPYDKLNQELLSLPNTQERKGLNNKVLISIAFALLLTLTMFFLTRSSTKQPSPQDLCFEREMQKVGAIEDPKGWAILSRAYCQSLYP